MDVLLYALGGVAGVAIAVAVTYVLRQMASASPVDRSGLVLSGTSVVVAILALVVAALELNQASGKPEASASRAVDKGSVTLGDTGGDVCAPINGDCVPGLPQPQELAELPVEDAQVRLQTLVGATSDPVGDAPWTYLVLGTNEQGVYYRDGFTIDDRRLPGDPVVRDARPLYVDCKVTSGWAADSAAPNDAQLTTWLKVRYPQPSDVGDFWVYGGYAFPLAHNGNVPECAER